MKAAGARMRVQLPIQSLRSAVLFFVLASAVSAAALAQAPVRVRGTIGSFDGTVLVVEAAGRPVAIGVTEKTAIVYAQPIALAEIGPGDFLGVTSARSPDGTLTAFEVRRFPKPLNPGHRPFEGRDDRTMTNATVSAVVESARGRELVLAYEGGSQRIVVARDASISTLVAGDRSQLVPGARVSLSAAPGEDGVLQALRIQVSPVAK